MLPETHSLVLTTDYRVPDPSRVYTSTTDPERVLVSIALETGEPVAELLRSRAFFEWFDEVGDPAGAPTGIVVVGITVVDDVAAFRVRIFEAFDDPREVMLLHELTNEETASRWLRPLPTDSARGHRRYCVR